MVRVIGAASSPACPRRVHSDPTHSPTHLPIYPQPTLPAGFGSSMVFGTFIGSLADKMGRKNFCILYAAFYIARYGVVRCGAVCSLWCRHPSRSPATASALRW